MRAVKQNKFGLSGFWTFYRIFQREKTTENNLKTEKKQKFILRSILSDFYKNARSELASLVIFSAMSFPKYRSITSCATYKTGVSKTATENL